MKIRKQALAALCMMSLLPAVQAEAAEATDQNAAKTAQEAKADAEKSQQLEPITVIDSAAGREDLQPDSISNPYRIEASARAGTEVFTAEDIKVLNPSNFFDLLDKAAGVNVTYQGRRKFFIVSQRGGGSFTYIIDGAVLPSTVDRILASFPLASIEQMEVVRGATSLTMGPTIDTGASPTSSGMNTGYIIIRTKHPKETAAIIDASAEKADGHPPATQESLYIGTPIKKEGAAIEGYLGAMGSNIDRPSKETWFDGRSSTSGMANGGFTAGKVSVNMMAYKDKGDMEFQRGVEPDGTLSTVKWYYDPINTDLFTSDATLKWSDNQATMFNLYSVSYDQEEHDETFTTKSSSTRDYEEKTTGIGLRHNLQWRDTLLQIGGQISQSEGDGANQNKGYIDYDTTVYGWSASVEQSLFGGAVVLDGGFRQDTKHIDNSVQVPQSSVSKLTAAQLAQLEKANADTDLDPSNIFAFGAHWQIIDALSLDARYYYSDQGSAGDFDMVMDDGSEPGAEKQERIEVTLAADFVPWLNPSLTWFDIDVENAKTATSNTYELPSGTYYTYTEADELRRGVELMLQGRIGQSTRYKVSWTYMIDNESVSDGVTTDANGDTEPENCYTVQLTHQWKDYLFNVSVKKVDEWTSNMSGKGTMTGYHLGDYTRVDASVKKNFSVLDKDVTLTLYGRNLTDEEYATRYVTGYYYDRGLTVGMGLTVKI